MAGERQIPTSREGYGYRLCSYPSARVLNIVSADFIYKQDTDYRSDTVTWMPDELKASYMGLRFCCGEE